jgi:hypothetical protein
VNQENGADRQKYEMVDKIQLGQYQCKVYKTEAGYVISTGDANYSVGKTEKDKDSAIEEVKRKISRIADGRDSISGILAFREVEGK